MKKFINEFKEFILRGNVIELSIGMLMGAAFGAVVTDFSSNMIQPIIFALGGGGTGGGIVTILGVPFGIGAMFTSIINFLITAFVAFLIVKAYNSFKTIMDKKEVAVEEEPGVTTDDLLAEILAELKKNNSK